MTGWDGWRVRRGSAVRRFSDRLVVQGLRQGVLDLSVCLTSTRRADSGGLFGLLAAACTSEGIRRDTGVVSWFHWPNLVTIDGRVVATTSFSLAEPSAPSAHGVEAEGTLRIRVNCFGGMPSGFPSALTSTSILKVLGVEIDVDLLRDKVLHALDWYHAELERGMDRKLVERIRPTISWIGRPVEVRTADAGVFRGTAKGLDDHGSLVLEQRGGSSTGVRVLAPESVELVRPVD